MSKRNITRESSRGIEFNRIITTLTDYLRDPLYRLVIHLIEVEGWSFTRVGEVANQSRQNINNIYKQGKSKNEKNTDGGVK